MRSIWDNPFGGLFDFNQDGKEDFGEQVLGLAMLEEFEKKEKERKRKEAEQRKTVKREDALPFANKTKSVAKNGCFGYPPRIDLPASAGGFSSCPPTPGV